MGHTKWRALCSATTTDAGGIHCVTGVCEASTEKGVRRLMRLMRLVPIYQEPNTSKKHPQHKIWSYLLRNTVIDRPNQVLLSGM